MEIPPKKLSTIRKSSAFIIKCLQVPQEFFSDRTIAKQYFRRFGKIRTISFKTKQHICLVEYTNEDSLKNALEIGGEYNGKLFKIVRHQPTPINETRRKVRLKKPESNWPDNPEIRSELEAMTGNFLTRSHEIKPIKKKSLPKPTIKPQQHNDNLTNEQSELVEILLKPADTIDEKLKILEARDKLLRIYLKKNWELNKRTGPTIGTCPDMCPEKERLLREIQHQVSIYEQNNEKRLDAKLAIKQYSRSSADQEAPLPQELRPVHVLQMTMNYLMHSIMDLCDHEHVNISEWYHFLWDRTRGIRKDITQQELCCVKSVELVEQCARFHIYCSARLINEDPSVFDQKINTENLTKCLQTLKYMYNDLKLKGIQCRNEPEFRGYIILLNLNDGNFMWEVQKLDRSIQQSKPIQFALKIYSAIDKNNYVKFFKLIKSTTLLNSCLLMRYFIQIRQKALKILLKSYTSYRLNQIPISIEYLYDLLGFESVQQTADFLQYYGLSLDNNRIILDRHKFCLPELPYCLDRAIDLIESKRKQLTIGEIVCGHQLPEKTFETHIPQDSFDANGYLCLDYELKRYLFTDETDSCETSREIVEDTEMEELVEPQQIEQVDEEIKETAIVEEIKEPSPPKIVVDFDKQRQEEEEKAEERRQQEIRRELEEQQRQFEQHLLEQKRREEEMMRVKIQRQQYLRMIKEQERSRKIELIQQQLQKKKQQEIETNVAVVMENLIKHVEINIMNEKLSTIANNINRRKLTSIVTKWRNYCLKKRKRKAIDFQPILIAKSVTEQIEDSYNFSENLIKRQKFEEIDQLIDPQLPQLDLDPIYTNLIKMNCNYQTRIIRELFWKVSINLSNNCRRIERVFDKFFGFNQDRRQIINKYDRSPTLFYCFDKNLGVKNDVNGCIFIDDMLNQQLLTKLTRIPLKLPVVLLLENCENLTQLHDDLNRLIADDLITNYCILINDFTRTNLVKNLQKALVFLSEHLQPLPSLEIDDFYQFLLKEFDNFWCRLESFTKWNCNYLQLFKQPNLLINLYNQHLDNLKGLCLNNYNGRLLKFPDCFKQFLNCTDLVLPANYQYFPNFWNNQQYYDVLLGVFDQLKLVKFLYNWPPISFDDLSESLRYYCCKNFNNNQENVYLKLWSLVLRKINDNFDNIKNLVWIDLIKLLVFEKLQQIDFTLYGTGFVNNSIFNQLIIVYDITKLIDYNLTDWFYINNPLIKQQIQELLELEKQELLKKQQQSKKDVVDLRQDIDWNLLRFDEIRRKSKLFNNQQYRQQLQNDMKHCAELMDDLDESYHIHKKISSKSEELLETLINQ